MKNYIKNSLLSSGFLFTLIAVCSPFVAYAEGIVPCGFGDDECTFCELQVLAGNVLNFMVILSVFAAALLFLNAGILYITSSTNVANIAKAHRLFTSALIGFLIILSAWLVINTVMYFMYNTGPWGDWDSILNCPNETAPVAVNPTPTPVAVVDPAEDKEALLRSALAQQNVTVNKPAPATEVAGLRETTISGIMRLSDDLGMPLVITGGSEDGHSTANELSHENGYKIDLGFTSNPKLTEEKMQTVLPNATSRVVNDVTEKGYWGYVDGKRVEAFIETGGGAHWDLIFYDSI